MLKLDLRDELGDGLLEALVLAGPDPVLGPHQQGAVQLALRRAEKLKLGNQMFLFRSLKT